MVYDLELISVGKTYSDGTVAVSDFDLKVEKGEFVAFLGPSGCGKSTTLRMIAGFENITNGEVMMMGRNVTHVPPEKRPTSMIFQNYALFPHRTIAENIAFGLKYRDVPKADAAQKVKQALDIVRLPGVEDRNPTQLSGGQQQRLCIARAIALDPEVILFDEPCSALDPIAAGVVEDLIASLRDRYTVLIVTHNLSQARRLADLTALFWVVEGAGSLMEVAETERFFSAPEHPLTRDYVTGARG